MTAVANLGVIRAKQFTGNSISLGDESSPTFTINETGVATALKIAVSGTGDNKSSFGDAQLTGALTVAGSTSVQALDCTTLAASGAATLSSTLGVTGAATLGSTLGVTDAATLSSTLGVTGAATLSSTLGVSGAATLSSTLGVTGAATLSSDLSVSGSTSVAALTASGASSLQGTTIGGDLTCNGAVTVNGALSLNTPLQDVVIDGSLTVNGTTTTINTTELVVEDANIVIAKDNTSDTNTAIQGAGITISAANNKSITYKFAGADAPTNTEIVGCSAFESSEDLILPKKTVKGRSFASMHADGRSQVIHMGDVSSSTAGHWMIVADIANEKLQFWYGTHIPDDVALGSIGAGDAKLAFEINKPA